MQDYPNTPSGMVAARSAAGGDDSRLWVSGATIFVKPIIEHVPDEVTLRQFKQGLTRMGLRTHVEAWRSSLDVSTQAGRDAADFYDESNTVQRQNPILLQMAASFGLTSAQVDTAFAMMSGL